MSVRQSFSSNTKSLKQSYADLERMRLHVLLRDAVEYPLVIVCAGSGYGKTRAVHSFLQIHEAHTLWLQLSEQDNNLAHFWDNLVGIISLAAPEHRDTFTDMGFPETEETFARFGHMLKDIISRPAPEVGFFENGWSAAREAKGANSNTQPRVAGKPAQPTAKKTSQVNYVLVFDDFHLIKNPALLRFLERTLINVAPNVTTIIISRTIPSFNLIGMMMNESMFLVNENNLCFNEDEITEYFEQLAIPVTRQEKRNIYEDTQGWAFAVSLLGISLVEKQRYEPYALEAMKKNVFRLIESEVFYRISEPLRRFLLRISLVDHRAANLIRELSDGDAIIGEMELLNSYIRYDFNLDTYVINHLFLEYLRQRQHLLTEEEKRDTYRKAGEWCEANCYGLDSLSFYEKSGDYEKIALKFVPDSLQIPRDEAQYALEIFDRSPEEARRFHPVLPSIYLKLRISLGQLEEAAAAARRYIEEYETLPETLERNLGIAGIYASWGLALRNMCTYTDTYGFDYYFRKMGEYYDRTPFEAFGKYTSMLPIAWATLVGSNRDGAPEDYISAIKRCIPDVSRVLDGLLIGYDDLLQGELDFYRGNYCDAEQCLRQSADKAFARNQYLTHSLALTCEMGIELIRGDFTASTAKLREIELITDNKDYDIRYEAYDIAGGFYLLTMDQPEKIPEWLKCDFSPFAHPSYLENYGNRVKARYHYQTRRYSALLAFINNEQDQQTILFGKIELKILEALSLYQINKRAEAFAALTEACRLAGPNRIVTPFVEYAKDMRTLTAAALKDGAGKIRKEWLQDINRKSSSYAKRKRLMISEYRTANQIDEIIPLSNRELSVLTDLSKGLSRAEIATNQNISVNTVKMVISTIYNKLCVNSLVEAIRIAAVRKII